MRKFSKFALGLAAVLSVGAIATSCGEKDNRTPEERVQDAYDLLVYDGLDSVTADIALHTELEGVAITYTATNLDGTAPSTYLSINDEGNKAIVTRPALGSTTSGYEVAVLVANFSYQSATASKQFAVRILEGGTDMNLAEFKALTNTETVAAVDAVVIALGDGCALIGDETGVILVYSSSAVKNLNVGDYILAEGSKSAYKNAPQFAYNASVPVTVTVLDSEPTFTYAAPELENWDTDDVNTYMTTNASNPEVDNLLGRYVKLQGIVNYDAANEKVNIDLPVAPSTGDGATVYYPNETLAAELVALNGQLIEMTGYTIYINYDRVNIMVTEYSVVEVSPEEKLNGAKTALTAPEKVYEDFELAATGAYGATITWASNNAAIAIGTAADGKVPATVTASTTEDITVTLTATISVAGLTDTKEFTVVVKKIVVYDHAGTAADPYSVADANKKAGTLEQGETTEATYFIKGIIADTEKFDVSASYGNATFHIKDTADSTETFLVYRINSFNGTKFDETTAPQVKVGDVVVVSATITNYKGTLETSQGGKLVSWNDKTAFEGVEPSKYGSPDAPITVTEALAIAAEECTEDKAVTAELVFATGVVATQPDYSGSYIKSFDLKDATSEILVYSMNKTSGVEDPDQNDTIVLSGYIKNYGGTIEFASANDTYPTIISNTRGTSTITSEAEGATVTGLPESGTNGTTFTFTVTADAGKVLDAVKVNGVVVEAVDGTYTGTVHGNTVITTETHAEGEVIPTLAATVEMTADNRTSDTGVYAFAAEGATVSGTIGNNDPTSYAAPARFYKGTTVTVSFTSEMTKVVFECNTKDYANSLSTATLSNATISVDNKIVTIELTTPVTSLSIEMPAQVRVDKVLIYTL